MTADSNTMSDMSQGRKRLSSLKLGRPRKKGDVEFTPLPRDTVSAANVRVYSIDRRSRK